MWVRAVGIEHPLSPIAPQAPRVSKGEASPFSRDLAVWQSLSPGEKPCCQPGSEKGDSRLGRKRDSIGQSAEGRTGALTASVRRAVKRMGVRNTSF